MQEALRARVHAFARERIRPAALEWDRMPQPQARLALDSPYRGVLEEAYEQGWHSALIPSELDGGLGLRGIDLHILYEGLGWGSADIAVSLIPRPDVGFLKSNRSTDTLTWIGHSSFLLQLDGVNILTDPHLTKRASPVWRARIRTMALISHQTVPSFGPRAVAK